MGNQCKKRKKLLLRVTGDADQEKKNRNIENYNSNLNIKINGQSKCVSITR